MEYPSLSTPPAGSIRFNTDSSKLEIYNGDGWWQIDSTSPEVQTGGARGIFGPGGGAPAGSKNAMDYINISSSGNAVDFGDTTSEFSDGGGTASRTRGVFDLGYVAPSETNRIDYVTMASTGNSIDFGDFTANRRSSCVFGNNTRAIFSSGFGVGNAIEYITIASTGNAADFGDTTYSGNYGAAAVNSPTRGLRAGGFSSPNFYNTIEYNIIATTGNAADFGDLTVARCAAGGISNAVRGMWGGGRTTPSGTPHTDVVDYVTIASQGNALDFGNMSTSADFVTGVSSPTRGCLGGGYTAPAYTVVIRQLHIMSTGDTTDFGDLTYARNQAVPMSTGHGGLAGGT